MFLLTTLKNDTEIKDKFEKPNKNREGGSLGAQTGSTDWSGTGLAPGTQKVPKVCNGLQKQARGQARQHEAVADFGTPRGLSKIAH